MHCFPRFTALLAAAALLVSFVTHADDAAAQIKQPGRHLTYSVELEPHLLVQYDRTWGARGSGLGPGLRVGIPLLQNGPITTINNSLALGFGLDWARFAACDGQPDSADCSVNQIWAPVVAQWNFWFTPVISAFGELGAAISHRTLDYSKGCPYLTTEQCQVRDLQLFEPVLFVGSRFSFSRNVGLLLRIGTPYLSIGADFTL